MNSRAILAVLALLSSSACTTHLQSSSIPTDGKIPQGYSYQLPHLDYSVEISRALISCPDDTSKTISFNITATAVGNVRAGEVVILDYANLAKGSKTSDIHFFNYPSGVLKSVNMTVEDKSADIAKELFRSVVSVGKIVIGLPSGGAAAAGAEATPSGPFLACNEDLTKKVASLPGLRAELKETEKQAKAAAKAASDYEADHKETDRAPDVVAEAARLAMLKRQWLEAQEAATKALGETVADTTFITRTNFAPEGNGQISTLSVAIFGKAKPNRAFEVRVPVDQGMLIIPLGKDLTFYARGAYYSDRSDPAGAAREANLRIVRPGFQLVLSQLENAGVVIVAKPLDKMPAKTNDLETKPRICGSTDEPCGVLYRTRAQARMRVCGGGDAPPPDEDTCWSLMASNKLVLFSDERPIPQLGKMISLPFKNGIFTNNTLTAAFSEDGGLTEFAYKKPVAEGLAAASTLNEGLGAGTQLISYERGRDLAKLQEAKVLTDAELAARTSMLALQPSQVTEEENKVNLLEAQRKRIRQEIEVIKAQRELDALLVSPE